MFSDHNKNKISINIYFLTLLYFYFIFSIIKIVPKINTSVLSSGQALVGSACALVNVVRHTKKHKISTPEA